MPWQEGGEEPSVTPCTAVGGGGGGGGARVGEEGPPSAGGCTGEIGDSKSALVFAASS